MGISGTAGPAAAADGQARLLVVEDEPTILELLSGSLRFAGYEVVTAASGAEALRAAARARPDLILLDVMIPDGDGFEVLRQIRSGRSVPVIFLTARGTVHDRVAGLTMGGDDYVTKPFSLDEVLARIQAVLRRSTGQGDGGSRMTIADLELDGDSHEVRRAGELISLTPTEFRLLRFLMANAGRVLSKEQIRDQVWEYGTATDRKPVEPLSLIHI